MNAAENIATVAHIVAGWDTSGKRRFTSIATLCRAAYESAARTIWMLSPTDPDERYRRCITLTANELREQANYHKLVNEAHDSGAQMIPAERYGSFETHSSNVLERQALIRSLKPQKWEGFTKLVHDASDWVADNPPIHVESETQLVDMRAQGRSFYSIASSLVHGLKWALEYMHEFNEPHYFAADSLASAVNMTECAVALFEAQAINLENPSPREVHYPPYLEPTIQQWAKLYQ
ncbi:hypothetical protein [Rhodococcus sp. NPDC004095]